MMVGMEIADSGDVFVGNEKMPSLSVLQNIGYMAQADSLYNELTGEENLAFFASLFKLSKKMQKERIQYVMDLVQLSDEKKKRVAFYSGGMKRRLSLAVALIQSPDILILDEPTVGIDPELRLVVWNELTRLKNEFGKTIIVTTHVMDEAEKCDRLAMIREGIILTEGSPHDLMTQYDVARLEDAYLHAGRNAK
jgi:ABC-2 type transport system ATP-binding protein